MDNNDEQPGKRCRYWDCRRWLPLTDFNYNRRNKDGRSIYCKECERVMRKEWVAQNPEKNALYKKLDRIKHPFSHAIGKQRARPAAAGGCVTPEECLLLWSYQGGKCANQRCNARSTLWIDHLTPQNIGGTSELSNIQLLCPSCSSHKGNNKTLDFRNDEVRASVKELQVRIASGDTPCKTDADVARARAAFKRNAIDQFTKS